MSELEFVLVAGSGKRDLPPRIAETAARLGERLARAGFGLVTCGWEGVDAIAAEAFARTLQALGLRVGPRLLQIVRRGAKAAFAGGEVVAAGSEDEAWELSITRASAVVLVGGLGGTYETGKRARRMGKPVLPLADTSGPWGHEDARKLHAWMKERWEADPVRGLTRDDLVELANPAPEVVAEVMRCLEKLLGRQALAEEPLASALPEAAGAAPEEDFTAAAPAASADEDAAEPAEAPPAPGTLGFGARGGAAPRPRGVRPAPGFAPPPPSPAPVAAPPAAAAPRSAKARPPAAARPAPAAPRAGAGVSARVSAGTVSGGQVIGAVEGDNNSVQIRNVEHLTIVQGGVLPGRGEPAAPKRTDLVEEAIRLDAALPEKAVVGVAFHVVIAVKQPDAPPLSVAELDRVVSSPGVVFRNAEDQVVKYRVEVLGDGFEVTPPHYVLLLRPGTNSAPVLFQVVATKAGKQTLMVNAYQADDALAAQTWRAIEVGVAVSPP